MTAQNFVNSTRFISSESIPSIFANLEVPDNSSTNSSLTQRFFRNQFFKLLNNIKQGYIQINDPFGCSFFGDENSDLHCTVTIYDVATYSKIALGGSNGSGQAYIDGFWSSDNPTALIRILLRNREILDSMTKRLACIKPQFKRRQPKKYCRAL